MLKIMYLRIHSRWVWDNYVLSSTQSVTYTKCVAYTVTVSHKLDIHATKCPISQWLQMPGVSLTLIIRNWRPRHGVACDK